MTKLITPQAVLSYEHLFEPTAPEDSNAEPQYSCTLVFEEETDLSDLCEKIQWAKDNDDKARIIAENAHEFVRNQLSLDNINLYVATLIHRIGELTVQGHNM